MALRPILAVSSSVLHKTSHAFPHDDEATSLRAIGPLAMHLEMHVTVAQKRYLPPPPPPPHPPLLLSLLGKSMQMYFGIRQGLDDRDRVIRIMYRETEYICIYTPRTCLL